MGSAFPSYFTIRSSSILKWYLVGSCLFVLLVLFKLDVEATWRLAGGILVIVTGTSVYLNEAELNSACSVVAFRLEPEHGVTLTRHDGKLINGTLAKSGLVTSFLILLNIRKGGGGRISLVLLPDSLDRDSFRRLRVALRFGRAS